MSRVCRIRVHETMYNNNTVGHLDLLGVRFVVPDDRRDHSELALEDIQKALKAIMFSCCLNIAPMSNVIDVSLCVGKYK